MLPEGLFKENAVALVAQQNINGQIFANYSKVYSFFAKVSRHEYTNDKAKKLSQKLIKELGQQVKLGF